MIRHTLARSAGGHLSFGILAAASLMTSVGASPCRALDFQLRTIQVQEDGYTHEHSCFKADGHTEMMIDLPHGWNTEATPSSVVLTPPNLPDCQVSIEKSPLTPDTPLRDKDLDTYRKRVLSAVPQGAVNVRISQEQAEPLPIFHWTDYEFVVDYDFYGHSLRHSALFINLNTREQIVMTASADKVHFDQVHGAGLDVMKSWSKPPAQ